MPRPVRWTLFLVLALGLSARGEKPHATPAYPHRSFTAEAFGAGETSYWLFEPDEPKPERAPVVVFSHGWIAVNPGVYGAWIEHLVRSGRIVIYSRY